MKAYSILKKLMAAVLAALSIVSCNNNFRISAENILLTFEEMPR